MMFSPQTIDLIIGIIAAEFFVISIWLTRKDRQALIPVLACFLASGALILFAVREILVEAPNQALALGLLTASFPAHVATLILTWRALRRRS